MRFRDDDRGASVQIGAILVFAIVVVWIALWQATVVPQENARVEFTHNQRVRDDMQDVRSAIVSLPGDGSSPSVAVDMAPEYPQRTLFVNPRPPQGTLRTVGTDEPGVAVTVEHAEAVDAEADDFWDGGARSFGTGALVYRPGYNAYENAPTTVFEHSVLYDRTETGTNVVVAGQDVVDGRRISLVALDGELSETRGDSYSLDVRDASSSSRTVPVTNDGASTAVQVRFATRLSADTWRELLRESGEFDGADADPDAYVREVRPVGTVTVDGETLDVVQLEFEQGETYELEMAKAGVGTGVAPEPATYAVDVEGNGSTVPEGGTGTLVVEVRDRFNNPVSGVTVRANASLRGEEAADSLAETSAVTGSDGRATFTYEAPADVHGGSKRSDVNVTFDAGVTPSSPAFDGGSPENVSMAVTVRNADGSGLGGGGGGGGAYGLDWQDPSGEPGTESSCDAADCTWNLSADADDTLDLTAVTSPALDGVAVDFAVNDTSVATLDVQSATTSGGTATTTIRAQANGTVAVYVTSDGGSDVVNVTLTDVGTGGGGGDTAAPTVTGASISNAPINDSEAGTTQVVTVTFNESMDTATDPTVEITGLASSPYSVAGSWSDSTTWTGTVTIADDDEEATATIEVSGARDAAGNTMSPNPDASNTFQVDTLAPTISNFQATNPSGTTVEVSFDASETLSTIRVDVTNSSGTVATLTEADFTESGGTYTATYAAPTPGNYTATLLAAEDSVGNDGASGQSDTVFAGSAADQVRYVSGSATVGPGTGRLQFDLENTGGTAVTIESVSVAAPTTGGNVDSLYEPNGGTGPAQREMYFDAASDAGYFEAGDASPGDAYALGTTVDLTTGSADAVTMDANSQMGTTLAYFGSGNNNNYNRRSVSGETVEITITFADGSTGTYTIAVP